MNHYTLIVGKMSSLHYKKLYPVSKEDIYRMFHVIIFKLKIVFLQNLRIVRNKRAKVAYAKAFYRNFDKEKK